MAFNKVILVAVTLGIFDLAFGMPFVEPTSHEIDMMMSEQQPITHYYYHRVPVYLGQTPAPANQATTTIATAITNRPQGNGQYAQRPQGNGQYASYPGIGASAQYSPAQYARPQYANGQYAQQTLPPNVVEARASTTAPPPPPTQPPTYAPVPAQAPSVYPVLVPQTEAEHIIRILIAAPSATILGPEEPAGYNPTYNYAESNPNIITYPQQQQQQQQPGSYQQPSSNQQPGNYQQPSSYQQPGSYQQPSSYQQPGGYQQPSSYQQPGGYQQPSSYQQPQQSQQPSQQGGQDQNHRYYTLRPPANSNGGNQQTPGPDQIRHTYVGYLPSDGRYYQPVGYRTFQSA